MRNQVIYKNWTFDARKVATGSITQQTSLPISTLAIDTFSVEVRCKDPAILEFDQNDPIRYLRRGKQRGIYYVQSIKWVSPLHYQITAISTVGLLDQFDHNGGIYTGEPVEKVVKEICGNIPVIIKSSLAHIKLYGWLPTTKARLNLQQVLFAVGANLVTDANGVLYIQNLWDGVAAVIDRDHVSVDDPSVNRDTPITSVTVVEHAYQPGTEVKTLYEGQTTQGQRIPWNEPVADLHAEGFQILESHPNYAVVGSGSGKLTGAPYIHLMTEVTEQVTPAKILNNKKIEDTTLVSLVNSRSVAKRLAQFYAHRETISVNAQIERERPGQVVQIWHPYAKRMVEATIASSDVTISGTLLSALTALVGFKPPQNDDLQYYDAHEILVGSGTWVPPDGVLEVLAILIGGGAGGWSGTYGMRGEEGKISSWTDDRWGKAGTRLLPGSGGDGGEGGEGGLGGKILEVTIQLEEGEPIEYSCGNGGKGGPRQNFDPSTMWNEPGISMEGSDGSPTTFGQYSSAEGHAIPTGWYDPITGEIYAGRGVHGVKGGRGGTPPSDASTEQWNTTVAGQDIVYKGVTYHGGPPWNGESANSDIKTFDASGDRSVRVGAGGWPGSGGGAAVGADGQRSNSRGVGSVVGSTLSTARATAYGGSGGLGATAVAPAKATGYGAGGDGGHGGGGEGGHGGATVERSYVTGIGVPPSVQYNLSGSFNGARGLGSDGGEGGDGCIILIYRRPKMPSSGLLLDKTNTILVDKDGRGMIC